jgi:hypothetical protein
MSNKELFKFLKFVSENDNFILMNSQEVIDEVFGWNIFLELLPVLETNNLIKENDDRESYTLTKLGREKLSELKINFENDENDQKAERKKLHNDSKLSEWQVKTFWPLFIFGIFGGLYSGYDIIKNLTKVENVQSKQITKEEMESELSKLRTLILTQKKGTLSIPSNSEKDK